MTHVSFTRRGRARRGCVTSRRECRAWRARAGAPRRTGGHGPDPELDYWGCDMASEKEPERGGQEVPGNARPGPATAPSSTALPSRMQQLFPVLSPAEIDRVRPFGDVRRFRPGEILYQVGKPGPGMYVILSGRVAVVGRDGLGQAIPVAEMAEAVPGEVLAEIGQLSGKPSVVDAEAVGEVEAIVVPPEGLRALLIVEAELGERILRALILRRVALIETGF